MIPEKVRMRLPPAPPAPRRSGLPVVAIIAPVVMAGVLWVMTSSPYVLLIACLGPVMAIAGWLDGRRTARRDRRVAISESRRGLEVLAARIEARADEVRSALDSRREHHVMPVAPGDALPEHLVVRLGTGDLPSALELDGIEADHPVELRSAIADLRRRASVIRDAPVVIEWPEVDVVATGPSVVVRAFARALMLQVVPFCAAGRGVVGIPSGESWAESLPFDVERVDHWEVRIGQRRLIRIRHDDVPTPPAGIRVRLGDADRPPGVEAPYRIDDLRPVLVSRAEATVRVQELARLAQANGWGRASEMPEKVALSSLAGEPGASTPILSAIVGLDSDGPVALDLEADGPHALVAGTTGSGKSELLITWVLALARQHAPRDLSFLLIDFKGGAAFAPLRDLPHVVGMVSDLDPAAAARAVESLRAELRRREGALALHGARSIAEMPPGSLSRLVIVVDEFAALVALDADLQAVFADLAARGRSLGLHLIVCTQRPAGVVRESLLANVTLRICLRVLDASDSAAIIGQPTAAELPADARGRGILADGRRTRTVQFALSDQVDAEAVRSRWADHPRPDGRPWLDPLPARLPSDDLRSLLPDAPPVGSVAIGAIDLPEAQRRDPLLVDPWSDGALLVLGSTGSGRTTALDMLGDAVDAELRRVPNEPSELWQALTTPAGARRTLVIVDDLDRTLAWADPEQRAELAELITRVSRETPRSGVAIAASARSAGGQLHSVQSAFEQRILLRLASREEHLLAGGALHGYRPGRRPGSCRWNEAEAQIAMPARRERAEWRADLPRISLGEAPWSIVTPRPDDLIARLVGAGIPASPHLGVRADGEVVVADVDGWLLDHAASATARRTGRMLFIGCSTADHRTLTRTRAPLPPLSGDDDAWLFDGATTARVRVLSADGPQARPSGESSTARP